MLAKKRGRPATGINPTLGVRLPPEMLEAVDAAVEAQGDPKPSRPEMVRRALAEWLRERGFLKG